MDNPVAHGLPQEVALAAEKPVPHVLRPGEAPSLPWEDLSKTHGW